ncbi:hypothetical protein EST38_g4390 [Candolleomyces aberdarensis]|uniref:RING-type domain-containing protein n=1 Tax=Candolleomyces aberdarensis TaxID=2316362 RepID=A0A4Q2DR55_9AGAR|nr:hypothetical protein EST38_g4390 [Candolleomyces aberdarensis]
MDLVKWLFGFQPSENAITQRHSTKLEQAVKAVAQHIPDADLAYLEDFVEKILPTYGLDRTIRLTIDYLKATSDYPKAAHRQGRAAVQRDGEATEESGDDASDEEDDAESATDYDDREGHAGGSDESDWEDDEGGESDAEDGGSDEEEDDFIGYAADDDEDEDEWGEEVVVEHGDERGREHRQQTPECGCCFSDILNGDVVHCPVGHVFCKDCLGHHASVQLTEQKSILKCMDTSGCNSIFNDSDLRGHLSRDLFKLYERLKLRRELKEANIKGLEECPSCDWACVMDVSIEEEPVFRCENEDGGCGVTSCRSCKKKDHRPYPCEQDRRLTIEESMTKALLRNCPSCPNAFIKEDGCNKMTCPGCGTTSCYVCRKRINNGYNHFYNNHRRGIAANGRCPLWDAKPLQELHTQEVQAAYERIIIAEQGQGPVAGPSVVRRRNPPREARARASIPGAWGGSEDEDGTEVEREAVAPAAVEDQHRPYVEEPVYARDYRPLVREDEIQRAIIGAHRGPNPGERERDRDGARDYRHRPLAEEEAEHHQYDVHANHEQRPQALGPAHARRPINIEQLGWEMDQAKHQASLARRRAREAQERVDEVRWREMQYYRMLDAGMDVRAENVDCFTYRPGQKCIRRTLNGWNPAPERRAREAHLGFALEEEQRYIEASEAACRRLREAQAALRWG